MYLLNDCEIPFPHIGSTISSDAVMAAGMLYVVLLQSEVVEDVLEGNVKSMCQRWLETGKMCV